MSAQRRRVAFLSWRVTNSDAPQPRGTIRTCVQTVSSRASRHTRPRWSILGLCNGHACQRQWRTSCTSPLVLVNPGQDANLGRARWVLGRQEDLRMERAAYRGSASADLVASAYTRTLAAAYRADAEPGHRVDPQ
ncbi:hypothetical protein PBRA_001797 [Plasmodiophora brassicae]|uniref:Uncharacterized protein n=1 Tax=Plasmodiophora brassicae TaxID=37360 RepID=A0A0G4IZG8_PLABS|nr:hypothetical protein PBRA_001797 [Plasmodiophora brassicae]